jgi:hypothetical protein
MAAVLEELLAFMWNGRRSSMEQVLEACGLYKAMEIHNCPIFDPNLFSFPQGKMGQVSLGALLSSDKGKMTLSEFNLWKICPIIGAPASLPNPNPFHPTSPPFSSFSVFCSLLRFKQLTPFDPPVAKTRFNNVAQLYDDMLVAWVTELQNTAPDYEIGAARYSIEFNFAPCAIRATYENLPHDMALAALISLRTQEKQSVDDADWQR